MSIFNDPYPSPLPATSRDISDRMFAQRQPASRHQSSAVAPANYPQRPDLVLFTVAVNAVFVHEDYERAYAFVAKRWPGVRKSRTMKSTADILEYIMTLLLEYVRQYDHAGHLSPTAPPLARVVLTAMCDNMVVMQEVVPNDRHVQFHSGRDEDCRIVGVAMCVGASAERVSDVRVGLGFHIIPKGPARPTFDPVSGLPDLNEKNRHIAMKIADEMARSKLHHATRGRTSRDEAPSSVKVQWLGQLPKVYEEWYSGQLLWASQGGNPTTDRAPTLAVWAEDLFMCLEHLACIRDSSNIPFPK